MTALQKIALGTAPAGVDGDTTRAANTKVNSNVDVLNQQAALTTAAATITTAQALTAALHLGKRVNIALTAAGTVQMMAASAAGADGVVHLTNTGTTVATLAILTGSGDTVGLSKLNPGESALMGADGVHAWKALLRGRSNSDNETVNGTLTVGGAATLSGGVAGALSVTGALSGASLAIGSVASISAAGAYSGVGATYSGNVSVGGTLGVTGVATFTQRPTFASKTPWDSGNLVGPMTLADAQTVTGAKTFANTAPGSYTSATIMLANTSSGGSAAIGFNSGGIGGVLRVGQDAQFNVLNFGATDFTGFVCKTLTQSSDQAFKKDIVPLLGVLDKLRGRRAVRFTQKSDDSVHLGVIAQEWQTDFPELVVDMGVEIDENGDFISDSSAASKGRQALGFNYSNASAVALQGVIDLQEALDAALARIAALEAKAQ